MIRRLQVRRKLAAMIQMKLYRNRLAAGMVEELLLCQEKYSEQVATEEIDYNTASTGELRRLAAQGDADAQAELEQREANKVNKG